MQHLVNSWIGGFVFLMSRTGYRLSTKKRKGRITNALMGTIAIWSVRLLQTHLLNIQEYKQGNKYIGMVFCYQNCSDLLWEKIVLEQFIQTVKQFLVTECFLICSWRFLISNKLEQLISNWKKILGFRNMQEKLEKYTSYMYTLLKSKYSIRMFTKETKWI